MNATVATSVMTLGQVTFSQACPTNSEAQSRVGPGPEKEPFPSSLLPPSQSSSSERPRASPDCRVADIPWATPPSRTISYPARGTYQNRGCHREKASFEEPLLIEAVNSIQVFLPGNTQTDTHRHRLSGAARGANLSTKGLGQGHECRWPWGSGLDKGAHDC